MTEPVLTLKHKDGTIAKIYQDESPESPRSWDNLGTINTWNRDYDFSDKGGIRVPLDVEECKDWLEQHEAIALGIVIHDYGSGGIQIRTDEDWSGSDGIIFATTQEILKEFPQLAIKGKLPPSTIKNVKDIFKQEIATLTRWADGEVYGYNIEKPETCKTCNHTENENVDSCWGYYGIDEIKKELESRGYKE